MKIGMMGGSFDPIHVPHIKIMKYAVEDLELDKFLVIPTKNNPWKDHADATDEQRKDMINIAISKEKNFELCNIEIDDPSDEKNYTYNTLVKLKEMYPDDELYYVIGMDQANSFDKWYKADEIVKLAHIAAFNRYGYEKTNDNFKKYGFIELKCRAMNGSSTDIKTKGDLEYLDIDVLKYISSHGIYLNTIVKALMNEKRYQHTLRVADLAVELAKANGVDETKAYVAAILHDCAKDMDEAEAEWIMDMHFPEHKNTPKQIWHQWVGRYRAERKFFIEDEEILQAIENHTTAALNMSKLDKVIYCADKYEVGRNYDTTPMIALCKENIDEGFKQCLQDFIDFSTERKRNIDPSFYPVYNKYVKGE